MKNKLVKFSFCGEVIDLQPESPPEILSWGGGVTQQNHHSAATLGLSTAVSISPQHQSSTSSDILDHIFGISSNPTALDHHDDVVYTPPPLWWLRQESNGVDSPSEDDDQNKSDSTVYNPTPLRWFLPQSIGLDYSPPNNVHQNQETKNFTPPSSTLKKSRNSNKRGRGAAAAAAAAGGDDQKKKKRRHDAEANDGKKKKRRRRDEEDQRRPLVPIKEIGGLMRAVESRGGSRPEFLYKKKLEMSDVDKVQHRVFLSGEERVMEFLSEEEAAAVDGGGKGLTIVGVAGGGRVYENLVMTKWGKMRLIRSDWKKVVVANNVKKDDVMEIWGYRENGKSCLAFNIRRDGEESDGDGGDNHAAFFEQQQWCQENILMKSNNGVMKIMS